MTAEVKWLILFGVACYGFGALSVTADELYGIAQFYGTGGVYYFPVNYSLSDSPLERICYISPAQNQVTLGFLFGASLDDQHHLLQGIGKRARHIKIRTLEEAKNPALKGLVKAAWNDGAASISSIKQRTRHRVVAHSRTKQASRSRRKTR